LSVTFLLRVSVRGAERGVKGGYSSDSASTGVPAAKKSPDNDAAAKLSTAFSRMDEADLTLRQIRAAEISLNGVNHLGKSSNSHLRLRHSRLEIWQRPRSRMRHSTWRAGRNSL
jgi:hypothetical protein